MLTSLPVMGLHPFPHALRESQASTQHLQLQSGGLVIGRFPFARPFGEEARPRDTERHASMCMHLLVVCSLASGSLDAKVTLQLNEPGTLWCQAAELTGSAAPRRAGQLSVESLCTTLHPRALGRRSG